MRADVEKELAWSSFPAARTGRAKSLREGEGGLCREKVSEARAWGRRESVAPGAWMVGRAMERSLNSILSTWVDAARFEERNTI